MAMRNPRESSRERIAVGIAFKVWNFGTHRLESPDETERFVGDFGPWNQVENRADRARINDRFCDRVARFDVQA